MIDIARSAAVQNITVFYHLHRLAYLLAASVELRTRDYAFRFSQPAHRDRLSFLEYP